MERLILHCDMDRFYCAVEEKFNPPLKKIPFAVCGDPQMRHSIVMSANNVARKYGVRAGLRFADARKLCPGIKYVTVDMKKYLTETKAARKVYCKYSGEIIPYGLDESWIILPDGTSWHEAAQIAELIKLEIMYSMELTASVGVSYNLIFSKIGSDYQKPNGLTKITKDNYKDIIWPMAAEKLLFVGEVREKKLLGYGIRTIGDIACTAPEKLIKLLKSKTGYDLWAFANGDDRSFNPENEKIGSIGNTITPPKDLKNSEEVSKVIYLLASAVCARLKKHGLKTRCVAINLKDNQFNTVTRQSTFEQATDSRKSIFDRAYRLFIDNYHWRNPLRSVGIRAANLGPGAQMSLFNDDEFDIMEADLNDRNSWMTTRLGNLKLENAGAFGRIGEVLEGV